MKYSTKDIWVGTVVGYMVIALGLFVLEMAVGDFIGASMWFILGMGLGQILGSLIGGSIAALITFLGLFIINRRRKDKEVF